MIGIDVKVDAKGAVAKFGEAGIPAAVRNNLRRVLPDLTRRLGAEVEHRLDTQLKTRRRLVVKKELLEDPRQITGRVRVVATAEPKLLPLWLEDGTKAHAIVAVNARALHFFWPKVGAWVSFKSIWHPGFAGIGYMKGALASMESEIVASITAAARQGAASARAG